jgi:hypothetical protein
MDLLLQMGQLMIHQSDEPKEMDGIANSEDGDLPPEKHLNEGKESEASPNDENQKEMNGESCTG